MIDRARLEAICREAGAMALGQWPGGGATVRPTLRHWSKGDASPVSDADLAVDTFLKRELGTLLPAAGWLSEETVDDPARLERDLVWLVDPIDGTRDFIRGRAGWAVSVALVSAGRPLIAALVAPARGETWSATAGAGAFLNGRRLVASRRTELASARIPADSLPRADGDLLAVEKPNSIALRIAMVADDRADLLVTQRWGHEWDIAAATLIAREAGAAVSDARGRTLRFNKRDPKDWGVLACAPALHGAAVARWGSGEIAPRPPRG
ncbi:3'(2'),5'-bisphosphate nucleotidase CysQ [Croceibacterium sp. TMG7-5b_MA50]|uniref:3'(2'),5'-bisphosphate nucleotidase CysQ n=1 Tax=Croceibacterium sp. TMG7-5b_MA50 TaxID=3121290 RepID=UPI0032213E0F